MTPKPAILTTFHKLDHFSKRYPTTPQKSSKIVIGGLSITNIQKIVEGNK